MDSLQGWQCWDRFSGVTHEMILRDKEIKFLKSYYLRF